MCLEEEHVAISCLRTVPEGHVRANRHLHLENDLLVVDVEAHLELNIWADVKAHGFAYWNWLPDTVLLRLVFDWSQAHFAALFVTFDQLFSAYFYYYKYKGVKKGKMRSC